MRIVAMRCRTAERSPRPARRLDALAEELGRRAGVAPRAVGTFEDRGAQRWEDDLDASRGCLLEAGGQVDDALAEGALPVLLAGDCSIAVSTLPTVARHRPDAKVLWLDAHGDFNTPQTSESGYLGGMALSGACGLWDTGFPGRLPANRVVLCGVYDLDAPERTLLERSDATVIGPTLETLVFLQNALDGAPTYVHLDLDVLDGEQGLTEERLFDLLDAVADACELVGVEVTEVGDDAERAARVLDPLLQAAGRGLD